jgi:hypothetical protein
MPYLAVESEEFLHMRQDPKTKFLAVNYTQQRANQGRENLPQIPQTLDQSYLETDQFNDAQDRDQVLYRYFDKTRTSTKNGHRASHFLVDRALRYFESPGTLNNNGEHANLLMVNQAWLWKMDSK